MLPSPAHSRDPWRFHRWEPSRAPARGGAAAWARAALAGAPALAPSLVRAVELPPRHAPPEPRLLDERRAPAAFPSPRSTRCALARHLLWQRRPASSGAKRRPRRDTVEPWSSGVGPARSMAFVASAGVTLRSLRARARRRAPTRSEAVERGHCRSLGAPVPLRTREAKVARLAGSAVHHGRCCGGTPRGFPPPRRAPVR